MDRASVARGRKELLARPPIAWPTIVLSLAFIVVWVGSTVLGAIGELPLLLAGVINFAAAFAAFTPMHDAAHRSVSERRWVNEVIGRLSSLVLVAPFPAFRWVHLEHHKHTNEPDADPDYWSGKGPVWLLPLRWLTQDLHYYVRYFEALKRRPKGERREVVASLVALYAVAIFLAATGSLIPVLALWLVPARLATAMLALSFDYLPHRPHRVTAREDRYRATHILADRWLTPIFLFQNYHLIHHLYPAVPFYRYATVWRAERDELLRRGATVKRLFGRGVEGDRVSAPA